MSTCSIEFIRKCDNQFIARVKGEIESMAVTVPAVGDIHTFDQCKIEFKVVEIIRHLDRFTNLSIIVYLEDN